MSNEKATALNDEKAISPPFDDPKSITLGKARVIWAKAIRFGPAEGWVLPGGQRTQDEFEARACAYRMNVVMTAA